MSAAGYGKTHADGTGRALSRWCCGTVVAFALVGSVLLPTLGSPVPASAAPPAILLRGGKSPLFALCPSDSQQREGCESAVSAAPGAQRAIDDVLSRAGNAERIVIFLSGYRTSFAQGQREAVTLARLFGPRCFVVYVDWGSHGKLYDYEGDARAARRNVAAFAAFVTALRAKAGRHRLDVYAYSMGTRLVAGAMATVRSVTDGEPVIDRAVLAAPDLTANDYRLAITRQPIPFQHVTVYASRSDRALMLSSIIHLHHRLGQMLGGRIALQHTDVVDASAADRTTAGHGYPVHDLRVICDVAAVFSNRPIPHEAWFRAHGVWTLDVDRVHPPLAGKPCSESE
jgi:pimeloyl-ACP methyl ester carboxylesterase